MKRIIYRGDGCISVVIPAIDSRRFLLNPDLKADGFIGTLVEKQAKLLEVKTILHNRKCSLALEFEKNNPGIFIFEPETEWFERVFNKATPEGAEFVDTEDILPDRRFRNAWNKGVESAVEVDLPKAKNQIMSELRSARNKELVDTDGLMARANEIGVIEESDSLKVYRQQLRDLPTTIDVDIISTVEELQTKYPEEVSIDHLKAIGDL